MSEPTSFADLGLAEPFLEALNRRGFATATPVQAATFAPGREGRDLLVQSRTGSGKTLAFGLPMLHRLEDRPGPQAIILAPTRELAQQVGAELEALRTVKLALLVGGLSYAPQLRSLERGAQVVVGTPGRVMDHLERGSLNLSGVSMVVLDEADEMLNMGFLEDVESILSKVPAGPQTYLFSATLPAPIAALAQRFLRNPVRIQLTDKGTAAAHADIAHTPVLAPDGQQIRALVNLLLAEEPKSALIFTRTKAASEDAAEELTASGLPAAFLHGDLAQSTRDRILEQFKNGHLRFLVATDVAARGLDIQGLPLVVHLSIPTQMEGYIHRSGRTGRAGAKGTSMPLVNPKEARILAAWARKGGLDLKWRTVPTPEEIRAAQTARLQTRLEETTGDLARARTLIAELGAEKAVSSLLALLEAERSEGFVLRLPPPGATDRPAFERKERPAFSPRPDKKDPDREWIPKEEWQRQRAEALKARRKQEEGEARPKKDTAPRRETPAKAWQEKAAPSDYKKSGPKKVWGDTPYKKKK